MSEHGATLQTYNQELVKCLENLKAKRNEIQAVIIKDEEEKSVLERNLRAIQDKLNVVNSRIQSQRAIHDCYCKTISDTERGFKKILETSKTLLNVAQLEASQLDNSVKKPDFRNCDIRGFNSDDYYE